jgi:hypothetical protein
MQKEDNLELLKELPFYKRALLYFLKYVAQFTSNQIIKHGFALDFSLAYYKDYKASTKRAKFEVVKDD